MSIVIIFTRRLEDFSFVEQITLSCRRGLWLSLIIALLFVAVFLGSALWAYKRVRKTILVVSRYHAVYKRRMATHGLAPVVTPPVRRDDVAVTEAYPVQRTN